MCKIPNIPTKLLNSSLGSPNDPKNILSFYVRKLINLSQTRLALQNPCQSAVYTYYNSGQAANKVFGHGIQYQHYITRMLNAYGSLFQYSGNGAARKFRPDLEKLQVDHPDIFSEFSTKSVGPVKEQIIAALRDEIKAFYESGNKEFIMLGKVEKTGTVNGVHVYKADCIQEHDDQIIQLPEGIKVKYKTEFSSKEVTILEFDPKTSSVVFQTSILLNTSTKAFLENSPVYLLRNLIERLNNIDFTSCSLFGLFNGQVLNKTLYDEAIQEKSNLDVSQQVAIEKCLRSKITYIWGPPGTGKSHTLGVLLLNLLLRKERTLVCSIANVAVDELTKKLVNTVNEFKAATGIDILKKGEILRIGYVRDKSLLKINELFPEDDHIVRLRTNIQKSEDLLQTIPKSSPKYNDTLSLIQQARHALANALKDKIQKAKIILCTSSKALLEEAVSEVAFDNLIIDEGSMMAPPSLLGLVKNVGKRLVVAGDFRQLGPIALGQTNLVNKWLHKSLFDLLGENIKGHPYVCMLKVQRRCAHDIIELVNSEYYDGFLETPAQKHHEYLKGLTPDGKNVVLYDLGKKEEYRVCRSASQSRYNNGTINFVLRKLSHYKNWKLPECTVGIITPYRAQVYKYKKAIEENERLFNPNMKIRVGTIHTFQGSECDCIIYDMVDGLLDNQENKIPIGNLYFGRTGEQLVNVAFSRAKSKLIIVGCTSVFWEGQKHAQVKMSVKRVFRKAEQFLAAE